jgi:hypothetical protein
MMETDMTFEMEEIPVTFEWDGKIKNGTFTWCVGAGSHHWNLHVNSTGACCCIYGIVSGVL